jgi:hypothetical protein
MGKDDVPEPSPETVRDAVAATGDPELAALVPTRESFVLRTAPRQGDRVGLFLVVPVEVAHPLAFMIAVDARSSRATVTTGRADAVREVLAADPSLRAPDAVWDLIRDERHGALEAAEVVAGPGEGADRYEFRARDRDTGDVARWRLELSDAGSTWQRAD